LRALDGIDGTEDLRYRPGLKDAFGLAVLALGDREPG
jgi:hypothetical protein